MSGKKKTNILIRQPFSSLCYLGDVSLGEGNLIFLRAVGRIIMGWLVGKIIMIILSFRVGTSENKNSDTRVKGTCAIMATQVTFLLHYIFFCVFRTYSNI